MKRATVISVLVLLVASTALAQDFDLSWYTIDGGGGTFSTGGTFQLAGTIGQPDAGPVMTGGRFALTGGFWPAATFLPGDLNCDGAINNFDIDPFVLALTNPAGYAQQYPNCNRMLADINGDGIVNNFDIDPFVLLLTQ